MKCNLLLLTFLCSLTLIVLYIRMQIWYVNLTIWKQTNWKVIFVVQVCAWIQIDRDEILKDSESILVCNLISVRRLVKLRYDLNFLPTAVSPLHTHTHSLSMSDCFDLKGTTVVGSKVTVEVVKREAQVDF